MPATMEEAIVWVFGLTISYFAWENYGQLRDLPEALIPTCHPAVAETFLPSKTIIVPTFLLSPISTRTSAASHRVDWCLMVSLLFLALPVALTVFLLRGSSQNITSKRIAAPGPSARQRATYVDDSCQANLIQRPIYIDASTEPSPEQACAVSYCDASTDTLELEPIRDADIRPAAAPFQIVMYEGVSIDPSTPAAIEEASEVSPSSSSMMSTPSPMPAAQPTRALAVAAMPGTKDHQHAVCTQAWYDAETELNTHAIAIFSQMLNSDDDLDAAGHSRSNIVARMEGDQLHGVSRTHTKNIRRWYQEHGDMLCGLVDHIAALKAEERRSRKQLNEEAIKAISELLHTDPVARTAEIQKPDFKSLEKTKFVHADFLSDLVNHVDELMLDEIFSRTPPFKKRT